MLGIFSASRSLVSTLCPPCSRSYAIPADYKKRRFIMPLTRGRRKQLTLHRGPPTMRLGGWKSPIRPGKVKAYDEALRYIRTDAANLRREIEQLKVDHFNTSSERARQRLSHDPDALKKYRDKLQILEVQSRVNLPEVRYAFKTGQYPFLTPVYKHLAEQKWRQDGALDLLMERVHQMHVIPDLLPDLRPTVDLRVQFPWSNVIRTLRQRRFEKTGYYNITPGKFIRPDQTRNPPRISATVFHNDTRYYTLLLLDPDVPNESTRSYQTYLHWLQPNIPLSAVRRINKIDPVPHLPYVPPHPQRGTPYHRYVLLLLPHAEPTQRLEIPIPTDAERLGFDLRAFAHLWGLDCTPGGGVHMWREVWHDVVANDVSEIYRNVLKIPEPVYGWSPQYDPYTVRPGSSRYEGLRA